MSDVYPASRTIVVSHTKAMSGAGIQSFDYRTAQSSRDIEPRGGSWFSAQDEPVPVHIDLASPTDGASRGPPGGLAPQVIFSRFPRRAIAISENERMWHLMPPRPLKEHRIVRSNATYDPAVVTPDIQVRFHRMFLPAPFHQSPVDQPGVTLPDPDDQQQGGTQESRDDDQNGHAENDWAGWNSRSNDDWRACNARCGDNQSADSRRTNEVPAKAECDQTEEKEARERSTRPSLRISPIYCRPPDPSST